MPSVKLTKQAIDRAPEPNKGQILLWDQDLKGFGVSILPSGVRSFLVRYRVRGSHRDRRMVLGRYGVFTVQQARKEAIGILADAARGLDPAAERREASEALTVSELGDLYLTEYAAVRHKDQGVEAKRKIKKNINPLIGKLKVEAASRADAERVHVAMSKRGPTQANRTTALLSSVFTFAEERGLRPQGTNPCKFVRRNAETKRERYLTDKEIQAYFKGLAAAQRGSSRMAQACDALRLILLTGARKTEILSLRWKYIDFQRRIAFLPDTKTGQRPLRLPEAAMGILKKVRRRKLALDWVFPSSRAFGHLSDVRVTHEKACELAEIDDFRVHDLRHSFASVAVAAGHSIPVIGKALGHARPATAERYSHLAEDPVRHAVDSTGAHLAGLMENREEG